MKKQITEYFGSIHWSDWDGETFKSFKEYINGLNIPDEAFIDHDYDSTGVLLKLTRKETDSEYKSRLSKENEEMVRYLRIAEDKERAEYERLKKKFGYE